jgi:hypothetical protein
MATYTNYYYEGHRVVEASFTPDDLTDAATSQALKLADLYDREVPVYATMKTVTAFSGGGATALDTQIEQNGNSYMPDTGGAQSTHNGFATGSSQAPLLEIDNAHDTDAPTQGSPTQLDVGFSATGDNVDAFTAGELKVRVKIERL